MNSVPTVLAQFKSLAHISQLEMGESICMFTIFILCHLVFSCRVEGLECIVVSDRDGVILIEGMLFWKFGTIHLAFTNNGVCVCVCVCVRVVIDVL